MFDFNSFYKKYNVDITKLKRDYEKNPLGKIFKEIYIKDTNKLNSRRYIIEKPYKEDIEYLYIELNIPLKDILGYFNLKHFTFGEIRRFYGIKKSYSAQHENTEKYYIKNYGVKSASCLKEIKEKLEQTCLERYGVKHSSQCKKIKNKIKQTNIERYGVENPQQCERIKEKTKQTNLERYGTENVYASEYGKEKIKKTNLERYGVENVSNNELIKEKKKQTCLKHYGVENPAQCPDIVDKIFKQRRINGTIISSSFEEKVHNLLKEKFIIVERQYKSDVYPFRCDFYIQDLNFYIEIQGHPSHGKEPFDPNNIKHQEILKLWQRKTIELKKDKSRTQYEDYIDTWTRRDPLKRKIAKENNLNWIEFFNMKQFLKWYNNI